MKTTIANLLLILILFDAAAQAASVSIFLFSEETAQASVVCGCTCCGDVCPMGAECCCYTPPEDESAAYPVLQLNAKTCDPLESGNKVFSTLFQSVKWLCQGADSPVFPMQFLETIHTPDLLVTVHEYPPDPPPPRA